MAERILVVDDDENILEVISRSLTKRGHIVAAANDGPRAWTLLASEIYDLVISDVRMPGGMSGLDLLEKTKEKYGIPVLMMSGFGDMDMVMAALRKGADDFFEKPLDLERMGRVVEKTLHQRTGRDGVRVDITPALFEKIGFKCQFTLETGEQATDVMRSLFAKILPAIGVSRLDAHILTYATEEAVKNAVIHGNREDPVKFIRLAIERGLDEVSVTVTDEGTGFDWRNMEFNLSDTHSPKGLYLMRNLTKGINFNDRGNTIQLIYQLNEMDNLI